MFMEREAEPGKQPWQAMWIITAPWAHPFWSQYALAVFDLTTPMLGEVKFYMPEATHEMWLWALNPDHKVERIPDLTKGESLHRLDPANFAYQFKAESNDAARERMQRLVDGIDRMELSPDTDFRPAWNWLFADGASLRQGGA
jgi:hypothetical protein